MPYLPCCRSPIAQNMALRRFIRFHPRHSHPQADGTSCIRRLSGWIFPGAVPREQRHGWHAITIAKLSYWLEVYGAQFPHQPALRLNAYGGRLRGATGRERGITGCLGD